MGNADHTAATTAQVPGDRPPPRGMPAMPYPQVAMFAAVTAVALLSLAGVILSSLHPTNPTFQVRPFGLPSLPLEVTYVVVFGCVAALFAWNIRDALRRREQRLAELRADSLPDRARHAAQVLQEATMLVEELQAELDARTALLEDVKRQVAETTERAEDMEKLSSVDDETTRILNKYFDEALKHRLEDLEHNARGREWLIGTVVAVAVGVIAILFSHFVLGF